jgi:RNA polymerase sigma-70 factor, ECF subfamily
MVATSEDDLGQAFHEDYQELHRLAEHKLGRGVRGRVNPSDVVQNAWVDAVQRYRKGQLPNTYSVQNWIRFLVIQSVKTLQRLHLGTSKRTASREVSTTGHGASSIEDGVEFLDLLSESVAGPSTQVAQQEVRTLLLEKVSLLPEHDREILLLRHVEGLSNRECADRLGLTVSAASKRYNRALDELESHLGAQSSY